MYRISFRKTCKAAKALQALQNAYGLIIDYSYKTVYVAYGFSDDEVPVAQELIKDLRARYYHG